MNRKIDAGDGHEQHRDAFDQGIVEISQARVMGREAADSDGGEAVRAYSTQTGDALPPQSLALFSTDKYCDS